MCRASVYMVMFLKSTISTYLVYSVYHTILLGKLVSIDEICVHYLHQCMYLYITV